MVREMVLEERIERLKEKGMVLTPQRLAVLDFVTKAEHSTVEEIYENLKGRYPTLSPATVYSNLEILRKEGEIQELTIRKEKAYFDSDSRPHHHFFCRKCQRILNVEIDISCPIAQRGWVEEHRVERMQACFYGICSECLKKEGEG